MKGKGENKLIHKKVKQGCKTFVLSGGDTTMLNYEINYFQCFINSPQQCNLCKRIIFLQLKSYLKG